MENLADIYEPQVSAK